MKVNVMTFNIRYENPNDGKNSFDNRKNLIKAFLDREMPDVIGFQEMVDSQRKWFDENITDYILVGSGRNSDFSGEGVSIAYNKSKFSLIKFDQFWLSPTPYIPGSRYSVDQSGCPRTTVIATLASKEDGSVFCFANTHLDHVGKSAKLCGTNLIMSKLTSENKYPFVLTGDFNSRPSDDPIKEIKNIKGIYELTKGIKNNAATFHGFGKVTKKHKIDYIFSNIKAVKDTLKIHTDNENGIWISDHYPISVTIDVK